MKRYVLIFIILVLTSTAVIAQHFVHRRSFWNLYTEDQMFNQWEYFPSIFPYVHADSLNPVYDSLVKKKLHRKIYRKLFYSHLLRGEGTDYQLYADPLFDFSLSSGTDNTWINTRGARISGRLGRSINFYSSVYENQATYPGYVDAYVDTYGPLPGYGKHKTDSSGAKNIYDFTSAFGAVDFSPHKSLHFQLGHDKLFIGSGYRSLLLSDFGFQQLYFSSSYCRERFRFTNIAMQWIDPFASISTRYPRKAGSVNFLEFRVAPGTWLGAFDAVVLQEETWNYHIVNPLIFSRSIALWDTEEANVLMGLNLRSHFDNFMLYAQWILDDLSAPGKLNDGLKTAWQIGAKAYDIAGIESLSLMMEHNYVSSGTYMHDSADLAYRHYNHFLAHPAGNNFMEFIGILEYMYHRVPMQLKYVLIRQGDASQVNQASGMLSGNVRNRAYMSAKLGFIVNPSYNWTVYAGLMHAKTEDSSEMIFQFGMRSFLRNKYFDF